MSRSGKYDDADYHYGDEVFAEKNLPLENGGTHIGFFLAWVLLNRMESDSLVEVAGEAIEKVRKREMTGREFLFEYCDEKLMANDLGPTANNFAEAYYDRYLEEIDSTLGSSDKSVYEIEDTWTNYDVMAAVISKRFEEFQAGGVTVAVRPWWQFWKR
jgi:hypothetical protein